MKSFSGKADQKSMLRALAVLISIMGNVLLSYIASRLNLPVYLDTIGTIVMAAMGGLFPGIITAVGTDTLCLFFNINSAYFAFINAMMAIFTAWFVKKNKGLNRSKLAELVMYLGLISGSLSGLIQWGLFSGPQNEAINATLDMIAPGGQFVRFISFMILNICLNIVDKGICALAAMIVMHFIPERVRYEIRVSGWRQTPLSEAEEDEIRNWGRDVRHPLRKRMSLILVAVSLALLLAVGTVSIYLYFSNVRAEKKETAIKAASFAADMIDPDMVDEYIRKGEDSAGYTETKDILRKILINTVGLEELYVFRAGKDGLYSVFDLSSKKDAVLHAPGDRLEPESILLSALPQLSAGENVGTVDGGDLRGWRLIALQPVKNSNGVSVCYTAGRVSAVYINNATVVFLLRTLLILAGVFVLILAYGLWTTGVYMVYPINSMAACLDDFALARDEQSQLDDNVRKLRELDIHTGDEVEKLYRAVCRMTLAQAEQMRNIRRLSDSTAKMQDGLIITMADMVENRDSDTGAHIQKTAAYVKIIVEGLQKNGYYAEKITPKFMSDVVRSAPLHDVGKINIPDEVLNKPGKLTKEEFEIMKTHTTAGKKIMEDAISTVQGESYLKEARNMAAYHHERWDGKGYPEGLHGEVIPLSARIMAVADVFDALTSPRVYKPAFPIDKALDIIQEGAGSQFDPRCVEVFMDSLTEVKIILQKYRQLSPEDM